MVCLTSPGYNPITLPKLVNCTWATTSKNSQEYEIYKYLGENFYTSLSFQDKIACQRGRAAMKAKVLEVFLRTKLAKWKETFCTKTKMWGCRYRKDKECSSTHIKCMIWIHFLGRWGFTDSTTTCFTKQAQRKLDSKIKWDFKLYSVLKAWRESNLVLNLLQTSRNLLGCLETSRH